MTRIVEAYPSHHSHQLLHVYLMILSCYLSHAEIFLTLRQVDDREKSIHKCPYHSDNFNLTYVHVCPISRLLLGVEEPVTSHSERRRVLRFSTQPEPIDALSTVSRLGKYRYDDFLQTCPRTSITYTVH